MSHLKSSHSVSLPIPKASFASERQRHTSRRNRKTNFSLRGDESPAVELPPLPRWMLNTPINSKFPMVPAPKGKIVLFTTDLCKSLHPAPSKLAFDPTAQGVSSEYQSLHDPHLKNHYWQSDSFGRLVRGGFVTSDGKVKCTLKEFNEFQQYLKRVRLEKMDQDYKRLLEIEREEKVLQQYDRVKTADQLAHDKRLQDAQKRWKKNNKERQKRLKQQLDAYDAKHACIITDQQLRHQIDEVKRELEEQKRVNHKLQMEKEEHEKKIIYLKKRAVEERRRVKVLEKRQISGKENRQKLLEEKWERKMISKDSRFANEYLEKLKSSSKLTEDVSARKRKTELSWLKQEADLARITEARMKKAAEEEIKITKNLDKKLGIIRKRFERKFKKLQAMLRSGGIPPVVQLQRTHLFAERKVEWEMQQDELKIQQERERIIEREMRRQRTLERQQARAVARARAAVVSAPVTCIELLDKSTAQLPIVAIGSKSSWVETMSKSRLSAEVLPPIKSAPSGEAGEDAELTRTDADTLEEEDKEEVQSSEQIGMAEVVLDEPTEEEIEEEVTNDQKEDEMHAHLAQELITQTIETAVAKNLVHTTIQDAAVKNVIYAGIENAVLTNMLEDVMGSSVSVALETEDLNDQVVSREQSVIEVVADEIRISPLPDETRISTPSDEKRMSTPSDETPPVRKDVEEPLPVKIETYSKHIQVDIKDSPCTITAKYLAVAAIGSACDDLHGQPMCTVKRETESKNVQVAIKDSPSTITAKYLSVAAIGSASDELDGQPQSAVPRRTPFRQTPSDMARQITDEALNDIADGLVEGQSVDGPFRKTPSHVGRGIARDAVQDAVYEVSQEEYELRQTPSNVGRHLTRSVMLGAVDELDEITEAKLYLTFKGEQFEAEKPCPDVPKRISSTKIEIKKPSTAEVFQHTPSIIAKELATSAVGDAMIELQDIADNFLGIDRALCVQTPSGIARDLADTAIEDAAEDIQGTDGVEVETRLRQTRSNVGRKLAKSAISRAHDDLQESVKIYKARKRSFYKSRTSEIEVRPEHITRPRKVQSDASRDVTKRTVESATKVLDREDETRQMPSDQALEDLETDPVMHVIYRRTPSNLARILAEDAMEYVQNDLKTKGEPVVTMLRKTPSNVARSLAKGAVVDALHDINNQVPQYTTPSPVRKTPSDMSRGLAEGVLLDAVGELEREGKQVDREFRSTPSNIARGLAKTAVVGAEDDLDRQSPVYILPTANRRTPSDIARAVTDDVMTEAIDELESSGHLVDGKTRKTPSNMARNIIGSVITDAEDESEQGPTGSRSYKVQGKTSSCIARAIASDAIADSVDDIEGDGKSVEGTLRKTPSNLGRFLAQDAIGEALGELDDKAAQSPPVTAVTRDSMAAAPSLMTAQDLAAAAINAASKDLHVSISKSSSGAEDLEFNDEDLEEIWGHSSVLLASVMDVFSGSTVRVDSRVCDDDDEDEEDEEDEEVIGFLENALIAEDEPILTKSGFSLTDIDHVSDDGKLVVEGAVKFTSVEGLSLEGSVTEAALSMESLSKNASGQLIRESSSSDSSPGEDTTTKHLPDEDDRKGPRYFKLVPLYNNKTIDVGDDVLKSNLSAISIKPDIKTGLSGAHHPQSRNSFRNIFRPDMTHCEGSAKCLKDTLVTQLAQQSSSELRKKVLDECCKVLEEPQPDITAKHSDEALVTVGDVEGVCMWPKRKHFKAHVIDEPVVEVEVEEEENQQPSIKNDSDDKVDVNKDSETVHKSHSSDKTHIKKSESLLATVVSKVSDVFRPRSSATSAKYDAGPSQSGHLEHETVSDEIEPLPEEINHASDSSKECIAVVDTSQEHHSAVDTTDKQPVSTKVETDTKSDGDIAIKVPEDKEVSKLTGTLDNAEHEMDDPVKAKSEKDGENPDDQVTSSIQDRPTNDDGGDTEAKNTTEKSVSLDNNTSGMVKSLTIRKSSSASIPRQKSNVSFIYVQPADPKLSRSSCTVLRAGKSISRTSGGSISKTSKHRVETPSSGSRRSSREFKRLKSTSREVHKTGGAKSDGNNLQAAKVDSEDTVLRQFKSLTAMRKLSQQAMPSSSHRILEMATKLSHSASELEGTTSGDVGSDQSTEMHTDAMWPVSRPASSSRPSSSQCGSELPEEGLRTPPGEQGSASQQNTAKQSPTACPEQLNEDSKQIAVKETPYEDEAAGAAAQPTDGEITTVKAEKILDDTEEYFPNSTLNIATPTSSNLPDATLESVDAYQQQASTSGGQTATTPGATSSAHKDDHHHSHRPGVLGRIISRVFSHASTSSSHHVNHHRRDSHHGSVLMAIISRVFSIARTKSNQVVPVTDDVIESDDEECSLNERNLSDKS